MTPARVVRSRVLCGGALACAVGCLDLAHTNPFDPASKVDVRVSGPDSTYSIQQIVTFSVTSTPAWSGVVAWRSTNDNMLHSLGDGRFGVLNVAAAPNDTVSVVAVLGTHTASHRVVVTQRVVGFDFVCNSSCFFFRVGASGASIGFDGRDANGYGTRLPFAAQVVSSRPGVLRIDQSLPARPGALSYAVTPLAPGTAYVIASSGGVRDSALVTVQ